MELLEYWHDASIKRSAIFKHLSQMVVWDVAFAAGWGLLHYGLGQVMHRLQLDAFDTFYYLCLRVLVAAPPFLLLTMTTISDLVDCWRVMFKRKANILVVTRNAGDESR